MKNRICAALLTLVLCLPLAGCAGGASSGISVSYPAAEPSSGADSGMQAGKAYTVGILQQMEHTSLDEIREAVEAGLARGAAAGGYTVEVVYKNAQGDPTAIRTIAEQFAAQGVDVIVPIATGAAQGAAAAAQDVPIVFSAVADPVAAGLVDAFDRTTGNITGVSNGIDVAKIFALADELTPGIGTYGFVYNEGEVNSQSIIEKAKAFLDARGLAYEEVTVASSGEVQQAAASLQRAWTRCSSPTTTRWPARCPCWRRRLLRQGFRCIPLRTAWCGTAALPLWASIIPCWAARRQTWCAECWRARPSRISRWSW